MSIKSRPSLQNLRDGLTLAIGILTAVNDLLIQQGPQYPRPYALAFSATCLGLPALLSWDRAKADK